MIQAAVPPLQLWSHSCVRELFQPAGVLGLLTQVRGGKYLVRIFTIYPSPPDCPDNGFCCFDGCVNTCLDGSAPATTKTPPTRPPTPAWTTPPSVFDWSSPSACLMSVSPRWRVSCPRSSLYRSRLYMLESWPPGLRLS